MPVRKTLYSSWFRKILQNSKDKKQALEQEQILKEENLKKETAKINAEKERVRRRMEAERATDYETKPDSMKMDFRIENDDLDNLYIYEASEIQKLNADPYKDESKKAKNKRLKEEKAIAKAKEKQLKIEAKEKEKALKIRTEMEQEVSKAEAKEKEANEKIRIRNKQEMIAHQRKLENKERKYVNYLEKNKTQEEQKKARQEAAARREQEKRLELEYERQERLRREEEETIRRIEKKRRKASGSTPLTRFQEKFRTLMRIYSFQNLKDTINTYGYSYSMEEFLKQSIGILVVVAFIAWYSKLRGGYFFFVVAITLLSIPFLLYSWFNQLFSSKRFEMVQSYLSNILPIFMQKPKIRYALQEVKDMSQGQMENAIQHAIDYIDTTSTDENVMATALTFIETEFPNSRIKAVHKLLLDVEKGNSEEYAAICENMYVDVESWIRRVYSFQKELKQRRNSLIILCGFTLILNAIFTVMYSASEIFDGFTDTPAYQMSTLIFTSLVLLAIALILTKLHGSWLIYDSDEKEEIEDIKAYTYIHMKKPVAKKSDITTAILLACAGVFVIFGLGNKAGLLCFVMAFIFFNKGKMTWNSKKNRVSKSLMLEFPVWLRGVALNLHEMTVINAIKESQKTCSFCMKQEIDKFFEIYDENPTSIKAFNEFLAEYKIEDVQASMKVLFTIQSMSAEETQKQISMLITRNQELLTKTETIKNKDSLGSAEMLGYAPMVLLTAQLLVSMCLMFIHIMNYMNRVMEEGLS